MKDNRPLHTALWVVALLVVAWRLVALWYPHPAQTDPGLARHAMAFMALWFLGCGLWTGLRVPGRLALLFAGYCLTAGLHWGGPIGYGPQGWQNVQLAFYLVVSSALGQALFLHVALAFEGPRRSPRNRLVLALVYLPTVIGGLLLLALMAWPENRSLLEPLPVLILAATLSSLAGAGVWFMRWKRATGTERRQLGLTRVVLAIVVGWLPYTLVSVGLDPWPEYSGLFNLPMLLEPTAVAMAIHSRWRAATAAAQRVGG